MKKIILSIALAMLTLTASAVPARRTQRTLTLSDGTQVTATLSGDENYHYWKTADGRAFVMNEENIPQEISLQQAQSKLQAKVQARNAHRIAKRTKRKAAWGAETNPISGERKGLVILVNYKDKKMQHTQAEYNDYFNKAGYSDNNCTGSVRDYFLSQSYGKFSLDFDVMGPVTLSKNLSYYGDNDSDGNDKHAAEMVAEAVKLAVSGIDLKRYDWDGDGYVDQVYVVYAGYGEHADAPANTIWPHEFELSEAAKYNDGPGAITINGVTIDTYACSSELRGSSGNKMDGIGTACHEFSHCLAIPDMYDTSADGENFGMNVWDLMDYGSYNGEDGYGETPAPFTSYERMYCGWLTPVELTQPCNVNDMPAITKEPVAYLIRNANPKFPGEYYLLENHQQESWDAYAPAHGMLILHVDFNSNAWKQNTVNNVASHQRMTIIPADGKLSHYNTAGDTWPGTSKKTALTDSSNPAAKLYNLNSNGRKFMGRPIENIAEKDGLISFTFDGGKALPQLATPTALPATQVTASGFTAQWQKVEGATSYEVQLTATGNNEGSIEESILLDENFKGFNNGKTQDGNQDVANKLDEYTQTTGWTGLKLFTTPRNEVKMGSSSVAGRLTTPAISPSNGVITVVIVARWFNEKDNKLQIGYSEGDGQAELLGEATLENEDAYFAVPIEDVSEGCQVVLFSSNRAYVSRVIVLDGTFSDDDLSTLFKAPVKTIGKRAQAHKSKSQTVTTAATSYTFTNLTADATYTYRVRALADGFATSNWSEPIQVSLATGIHEVTGADDASAQPAALYDLLGHRITGTPQRGIYIKDGRKIMVR